MKNSKNVWWNDVIKAAFGRKEVLGARDEVAKGRCMKVCKGKKRG